MTQDTGTITEGIEADEKDATKWENTTDVPINASLRADIETLLLKSIVARLTYTLRLEELRTEAVRDLTPGDVDALKFWQEVTAEKRAVTTKELLEIAGVYRQQEAWGYEDLLED